MSGGNKKKPTHIQGWEEAGSEFYQESYPTDADADSFHHRDAKHWTTLLPSKQTRAAAAATIRIRTNDNRTHNRSIRRDSTVHCGTMATTNTVQMSRPLSETKNEEVAWENIMQIKTMPIPMSRKISMKKEIRTTETLKLQGYDNFNWKRRKMWSQFKSRTSEIYGKMELWHHDMKRIEGNFGTGVKAYFYFLKWLLFVNFFIFFLIFCIVTLPAILLTHTDDDYECIPAFVPNGTDTNENTSQALNSTKCCSAKYRSSSPDSDKLLDFIQGTGIMEHTAMFYGYYSNEIYTYNNGTMYYNLPLAYICIILVIFAISLIFLVRSAADGFREKIVENEGQFYQYCNLVFCGWDFCIHSPKAAQTKHQAISRELRTTLETEKFEEERQCRSKNERTKLIISRIIVNMIVVFTLAASGFGVFTVFEYSNNKISSLTNNDTDTLQYKSEQFFFQFLPSLLIVCLNIVLPIFFKFLISFEHYSLNFVLRLTLVRTVMVRIASLAVFYATLFKNVQKITDSNSTTECWETFVGQQVYKLLITDFAVAVVLTCFVNYPRAIIAKHFDNKFVRITCQQSFDIPKHVLDIVYLQTLSWFGLFFAPLLSALSTIIFFLMFYVKKIACLKNSKPSDVMYRYSSSNSLFVTILLFSYVAAICPIAYSFSELDPSKKCGPFCGTTFVWEFIIHFFRQTHQNIQDVVFFITTAGFAIPCFLVLIICLYYYVAVNAANRHMVSVLKDQLVLEGRDKQYLINRLNYFQDRNRYDQEGDSIISRSN